MAGKTAGIRFPGHSYESCKSPRQMERENEMIVISQLLKGSQGCPEHLFCLLHRAMHGFLPLLVLLLPEHLIVLLLIVL